MGGKHNADDRGQTPRLTIQANKKENTDE